MTIQRNILVAAAALTLGASAFAQANKAPAGSAATPAAKVDTFKSLDKDHSGYIERSEASAATGLAAKFGDLDANKDGKLDSSEYAKQGRKN
jgi:hypothetical protein